jgi:hypothetical protein
MAARLERCRGEKCDSLSVYRAQLTIAHSLGADRWSFSTAMRRHTQPGRSSAMGVRCYSISYTATADFHLFGPLKRHLLWQRLVNDDVIVAARTSKHGFHQGFFGKVWDKCLNRSGRRKIVLRCVHVCKELCLCGNKCQVTVSLFRAYLTFGTSFI